MARLVAFGFTDAQRTQAAVRELTRGLNRASRLMQQLLPLMLDWLSTSPDPDLGLLQLRNLLTGKQRQTTLVDAFRESPQAAQRLCVVLGHQPAAGRHAGPQPRSGSRLPDPERLATRRPRRAGRQRRQRRRPGGPRSTERQEALRRWNDRNRFGIAAHDLFGLADVSAVGRDLTTLAEAVVEVALAGLDPQVPFAVIAMGRFGGAELSYASDLDVIFVFDGSGAADAAEADRVATAPAAVRGRRHPGRAHLRDRRRPAARGSPGLRWPAAWRRYAPYWEHYALVWERQAMIRARPVAGDLAWASGCSIAGPGRVGRRAVGRGHPGDPSAQGAGRARAHAHRRGPGLPPQAGPRLAVRHRVDGPAAAAAPRRGRHRPRWPPSSR